MFKSKRVKQCLLLGLVLGGGLFFADKASAQAAPTTDIDQLRTEGAKISAVYQTVAPTAVAVITFAAGAKVFKRVAYS